MGDHAETRRREATRAIVRYFLAGFLVVLVLGSMAAYAVVDAQRQRSESHAVRLEYCRELEKLKAQNRDDVAQAIKDFPRTLRLLKLEDTPEIRRVAREGWNRKLERNAAKPCPYEGEDV
jgi:hypothetical protein